MLRNRLKTLLLALVTCGLVLAPALPVHAQVFDSLNEQCAQAPDSTVCQQRDTKQNPVSGESGIILQVTRFLGIVTGIVSVIMIIISGIRFVTSHGDPQTVNAAKNTILYAVIGLVVVVIAQVLVAFVVRDVL